MMQSKPYENLKFYKDICEIRQFVSRMTKRFEKSNLRLVSQMRDAARSAKQNIREGYRKGTLGEFLHSIRISQGSLEELSGDMEDCREDGLISTEELEEFNTLLRSASYMSTQYLKAMSQKESAKHWKVPFKNNNAT